MDPFSHAALGRTLIACVPDERYNRALVMAGTLGALSPDLDAVVMPFGWDLYLRAHEIGTHSLIGTVGCGLLTASVIRLFAPAHRVWMLSVAAWCGAVTHVVLDLLSSARLRVLWPLVDHHVSVPLVAMADPWLAAILVPGAVALTFVRRKRRHLAAVVVGLAAAFLLMKAVLITRAIDAYRMAAGVGDPAAARIVEARWAAISQWHVFDRAAGHLRFWRTSGAFRHARLVLSWPLDTQSSQAAASRTLPTVRNFLRVHDLVFAATVERTADRKWVLWSDIRYCWNPDAADAPKLEPIISESGTRLSCALWFGGEFDRSGTALQQLVKVGGFTQARAVHE